MSRNRSSTLVKTDKKENSVGRQCLHIKLHENTAILRRRHRRIRCDRTPNYCCTFSTHAAIDTNAHQTGHHYSATRQYQLLSTKRSFRSRPIKFLHTPSTTSTEEPHLPEHSLQQPFRPTSTGPVLYTSADATATAPHRHRQPLPRLESFRRRQSGDMGVAAPTVIAAATATLAPRKHREQGRRKGRHVLQRLWREQLDR